MSKYRLDFSKGGPGCDDFPPESGSRMRVEVQRNETSLPIIYRNVLNAYTKGGMYCILIEGGPTGRRTHKFPLCSLFRVIEDYPESTHE